MTDDRLALLVAACAEAGLDADGATLLRYHVNAVYHIPRARAVGRLSPVTRLEQAHRGVAVTRWLIARGFPATAPLDLEQPVEVDGCVVTFWRYYDQADRRLPPPRVLARLLKQLHSVGAPPYPLPKYRPLDSFHEESPLAKGCNANANIRC